MPSKHSIPISDAADMTRKYREMKEKIVAPGFDKDILANCETFDRSAFDTLLMQEGCKGIRLYYGMDGDNNVHAIFVGVDADNKDMLRRSTASLAMDMTDDEVMDNGARCPQDCPPASELNS